MTIIPYSNEDSLDDMFIRIDKQLRIGLSAGTRNVLNFTKGSKTLYLGYDKERRLIAIADPDIVLLEEVKAFRFDSRLYTNARRFINFHLLAHDRSYKYSYFGEEDNWLLFELNEDEDDDIEEEGK